jgi:hypothetical protein
MSKKKTVTVKHPVFKDIEFEVDQDRLDEYLASGWLEKNQRRQASVTDVDADATPSPTE